MENEKTLVDQLKHGDKEALVAIIDGKQPQLLAFITRNISDQLRSRVEPADILQEVSISALAGLDDIELGDRDPFSWLCQLAERRIIDAYRKYVGAQKRSSQKEVGLQSPTGESQGRGLIDVLAASITSPSQAFSRGQRELVLIEAIDQLQEEAQEALEMRYVENLPSKEIAQRLGKTDGATRVLLTRSLSRLQDILSENSLFLTLQQNQKG